MLPRYAVYQEASITLVNAGTFLESGNTELLLMIRVERLI